MLFFVLLISLISIININAHNVTTDYDVKGFEAGYDNHLESTGGYQGFDISTLLSSSAASCLLSSGYSFGVVRAYRSSASVDTNACSSLKQMGGFKKADVYLFPAPTSSKSASTQMGEMVSYLNANCQSSWSGRVWLDIEGTQYWLGSSSKNQQWYSSLVESCASHNVACGIYSSSYQWSSIFGSTSYKNPVAGMPLWYAHYENTPNPSFSDFSAFGGWSTPTYKQYKGTTTVCGMGIDENYGPAII